MSFSRVEVLVRQMQDVCDKVQQSKNLRCSRLERLAFPKLVAQLVDTANALSHHLLDHIAIKAPNEAAREIVDRFRLTSCKLDALNKNFLQRNLKLIMLGPQVSALDSSQVRARKKAMQGRCNVVGSLRPSHIVLWSVNMPPSAWAAGDMSRDTFDYLIQELGKLPLPEWPKEVAILVRTLSFEEPFNRSEKFTSFSEAFTSGVSTPALRRAAEDSGPSSCEEETVKKRRLNGVQKYNVIASASLTANADPEEASAIAGTIPSLASHVTSLPHEKSIDHANYTDASSAKMARMAILEKLEHVLGSCLYNGMMASRLREGEANRRIMTLTDAVRLQLASQSGEDFKLEIWLSATLGRTIAKAKGDSIVRPRSILGDYLFEATSTSNWWRQTETEPTGLRSFPVSYPHGDDGDCKFEVKLKFEIGRYLLDELYPS